MLSYLLKLFFKAPQKSEFRFDGKLSMREYPSPHEEFKREPGVFVVREVFYASGKPVRPIQWKLSIRTLFLDEVRGSRWFSKPAGWAGFFRGVIPVMEENFAFRLLPYRGFQISPRRKLTFRKADAKALGGAMDLTVIVDFYPLRWRL